jgi:hypothetical protein
MSFTSRASESKASEIQAICLLVAAGGAVGSVVISLILLVMFNGVANRPTPTLVQLADGTGIKTKATGNKERTPEVVERFVGDSLMALMNWSGTMPGSTTTRNQKGEIVAPAKDPGIPVQTSKGQLKVATASWQASFTLSEDFRQEFLASLGEMMPQTVFEGKTETILSFQEVSQPEVVGDGKWKVNVVANLIVFSAERSQGSSIPFNKEVFVRAIDSPPPLKDNSPIAQTVYGIRSSGLEITAIRDLQKQKSL